MKRVKKDQWKLAATMFEKSATGLGLMLIGLALTEKLRASVVLIVLSIVIPFLIYAALKCAGQGDTNGEENGDNHGS